MQGDFEKRVQAEMDAFNLTPSAPVWEKIEQEIRPRKKRRLVAFWFLLLAVLLAGGWWMMASQREDKSVSVQSKPLAQNSRKETPATPANKEVEKSAPLSPVTTKPDGGSNRQQNFVTKAVQPVPTNLSAFAKKQPPVVMPQQQAEERAETAVSLSTESNQLPAAYNQLPVAESSQSIQAEVPAATKENDSAATPDSLPPVKLQDEEIKPSTTAKDSILAKPKIARAGKDWQRTVLLQTGWSSYASGSLIDGQLAADLNSSPGSSSSGGNYTGNGPSRPQPVSKGFAFSAGLGFTKSLSDRVQLSLGLQYDFFSTQQKLGQFKTTDSLVSFDKSLTTANGYYTNTAHTDYTNRFHVLSLPVALRYQLFPSFPLYLSVGAAYGRLLQSNALTFSYTSNLYYRNSANLNRNYLPVFSSLQYRLVKAKAFALEAGPSVQYNLLKLQKENIGKTPHLFFAGLKTTLNF